MKNDISFFSIISRLGSFPQVFGQVKEWFMSTLHEMIRILHAVTRSIVFILFEGRKECWLKLMKNDHFLVFFSAWAPFPQVFGQVKEWSILKLNEIITVLDLVACPIIFVLFSDRDWQGGMLKVMKNDHFLVLLAVWVLSPTK